MIAVLRPLFKRAVKEGLTDLNPAEDLAGELNLGRSRADKREVKTFTRAERDRVLGVAHSRRPDLYPAILLTTHAGLRMGEVAGLEWPDHRR